MKRILILILSGVCIGIANVIPGVSGGTAALVLGIYKELLDAIKRINIKFLLPVGVGVVVAILTFSRIITFFLDNFADEIYSFFLGLVVASVKIPYDQMKKRGISEILFAAGGFVFAWYVVGMEEFSFSTTPLFVFMSGFVSISAMILPGISGAYVLMVLGHYKTMLEALKSVNLSIIIPFILGCGTGIMVFSWFLSYLLWKYNSLTMAVLVGLMLGSLKAIFPSRVDLFVVILFAVGLGFVIFLEHLAKKLTG